MLAQLLGALVEADSLDVHSNLVVVEAQAMLCRWLLLVTGHHSINPANCVHTPHTCKQLEFQNMLQCSSHPFMSTLLTLCHTHTHTTTTHHR